MSPSGEPQEMDAIAPPSTKGASPHSSGSPDRAGPPPTGPSGAQVGSEGAPGRAGTEDAAPCEAWSAWACIPLDQKPGRADVEVHALRGTARTTSRLTLDIKKKTFPFQKLTVDQNMVTPPPELEARIESERKKVGELSAVRRSAPVPVRPFVRPVPGEPTSIFGTRRLYNGTPRAPHPGLDLHAGTGTPVEASGPGVVVLAEELYFSGNTVIVDHGGGLFTIYAHLSKIEVAPGDAVDAGQRVGLSGATGRVTGPHLHWGAKVGDQPFDPTALLAPSVFR